MWKVKLNKSALGEGGIADNRKISIFCKIDRIDCRKREGLALDNHNIFRNVDLL